MEDNQKTISRMITIEETEWAKHLAEEAASKTAEKVKNEISVLSIDVAQIKGKLSDGINTRIEAIDGKVKSLEKMQWWQIGIMVTLVGVLIGGLWFLTKKTLDVNEQIMRELKIHMEATDK